MASVRTKNQSNVARSR